jgi:monoamine oxidase
MASLLGLAMLPVSCRDDGDPSAISDGDPSRRTGQPHATSASDRSVIVVGAGAAGLTAAHLLTRAGVDVRVLEAGATHGGRMRHLTDLVDFPIPLGAEWIHDDATVLDDVAGQPVQVPLASYGPDDILGYYDGALSLEPMADDADLRFVGSSWLGFFDTFIVPEISDRLQFDTRVVRIDTTGERVAVTDAQDRTIDADAVIVTVPVSILRARSITFTPDLDQTMWSAVDDVEIWGGIKVFIEFDQRFYPTFLTFPDSDTTAGQRLYYDAAHGHDTVTHLLGLFAVGAPALPYQGLEDDALRTHLLAELDEVFDGAASRSYRRHVTQDWSAEPHIRQAYVSDHADWRLVRRLGEPTGARVLFAGDAYTDGENWSEVHTAARSAQVAVGRLLRAW